MTAQTLPLRLRGRPLSGRAARIGAYLATLAVVVGIWFLITDGGMVSAQTLASPQQVWSAIGTLNAQGQVWSSVGATSLRILLSFVGGLVLGIPLGSVLWRFPSVGRAVKPYLSASYSIPLVVFYPMLLVLIGINDWPVVILTVVMTTIPIALNTSLGLTNTPRVLVNVGRMLERSPGEIFRQVRLPAAWPDIIAGMKLSIVYAVVGVVAMEFVAANTGLGNRIQYYYEAFNVSAMYAFILLTLLLAGVCVWLVLFVEAVTMRGRS